MHTGVDGEIYRGEYLLGKRHGWVLCLIGMYCVGKEFYFAFGKF